ncbi:MAG: hypothetical protein ACFFCZ_08655 [Promethearchaeota archaeon]
MFGCVGSAFPEQYYLVYGHQEAGAIGAAMLAWLVLKKVSTIEEIKQKIQIEREFVPNTALADLYDARFAMFQDLYKRTKTWYNKMNK